MNDEEYILIINNVSKTFPGVKALKNVSLDLMPGEVLAVCGENGAGKSTLMKIIAAIYQPDTDESEVIYQGQRVQFKHPLDAKKVGIILIFQELSLVQKLSVAENIFLGSLPKTKIGLVDWKKLYKNSNEVLKEIECKVSPKAMVGDLSIARQQMVEIARAIALGARVLILDEPTSSLTEREKTALFKNIRRLKKQGVGIIYITHKMDEVFKISDRISVLRDGEKTGTLITKKAKLNDVIELMIGRTLDDYYHKSKADVGDEVLRVESLTKNGLYEDINFSLSRGEVLGLYGLLGAGRTEIVETLFGIRSPDKGNIYIEGKSINIKNSSSAVRLGLGLVPENRSEQGLVLGMSCKDNLCLAKLEYLQKNGFLMASKMEKGFSKYKRKLSIVTPSANQKVLKLSGGNQQKIVIGKWLFTNPKILILDEPTKGIDVGAKAEIHKLIAELSEAGIAVIIISSEMPEIMGICNRIITINQGKITGEFSGCEILEKNLIKAITIQNSNIH